MSKGNTARKVEAPKTEAKAAKGEFKLTAKQQKTMNELKGPSKRVRYLLSEGLTRSQIVKVCPNAKGGKILYQHVRGIEVAMLAKQAQEKAAKEAEGGKKS